MEMKDLNKTKFATFLVLLSLLLELYVP